MAVAPRSHTTRHLPASTRRPTVRRSRDGHRASGHARAALLRQQPPEAPQALEVVEAPRQDLTPTLAAPHSGGRLLISDLRVAFLLTNEARYRAFERLGVRREDANLATLVVAGMLADATHRRLQSLLKAPGGPTRADALLSAGVADELLHDLGGPASRQTPYFGPLVALALLLALPGPVARRWLRAVCSVSRRAAAGFHHRYGYFIAAESRR